MLVLVTGGSGFVGAHTIAAATAAGHRIRVLARDAAAVERALVPLGVPSDPVEVLIGDVTDPVTVARAVRGVDAVVHAASVYSFDSRRHRELRRTNVRGTELVLDAARRFGVARTVYVSTFGAMLPAPGGVVGPETPPGTSREPYLASKAAAETLARRHQADGAPVAITYPPALLGPHDLRLGDQNGRLRNTLRGLMPMWPTGGFPVGDVRDTARLHAELVASVPTGLDRHAGPGRYLTTRDYVRAVRAATGRDLPTLFLPARMMLPFAYLTSVAQHVWPWHIPAEYGACYVCACDARPAAGPAPWGPAPRPFADTVADTVGWMHRSGLLTARQAGLAADVGHLATVAALAAERVRAAPRG
ncbi:NAD-dependent epimerase/dehydratase family protein [Longispora sp. NPDC051575]|uniref:NAD-dependent epimerase/dehydratase family protein n=1 Tax=Longispora sp. NPDC051575 TaxID=3154943 RepID=UPI00341D577B